MAAEFSFYAGENEAIQHLSGSGLGFYGSAFGSSVAVGEYQTTTWITDSNGTSEGPQVDNIKWTHANSGSINGADSVDLRDVPNYLSTLNVRFTNDTSVDTQNTELRIYDRSNIDNDPSGVTCKVAEIIHPGLLQTGLEGLGDTAWISAHGSGLTVGLVASPGTSGLVPGSADTQHDWYVALSASPNSIGSKTMFGLYVSAEYL